MVIKTHRINITPDKSLMGKLGAVGYRTEQAIAELVDNAIDARIPDTVENVQIAIDFVERRIRVSDDGRGMDKDELADAMTIARETGGAVATSDTLGRFGIGMKGACTALGRCFSITTSAKDAHTEYRAEYDEKRWLSDRSQGWENFAISERELSDSEDWHGTRVEIWNAVVPLYPNQVSKFKEGFGIRYSSYVESGQVSIRVNSVHCRPAVQEIADGSRTDVRIPLQFNREIAGSLALLKKRSIRGNYGIHLFWNGRLIKAFAKFGFAAHPESARVVGSLNLDHVPVNYAKTRFLEDSAEYRDAEHAFAACDALRSVLHRSRSETRPVPPVRSVFDYFAAGGGANGHKLDTRVRMQSMRDEMGAAEVFEVDVGGKRTRVKFVADGPHSRLYTFEAGGTNEIRINKDSDAFHFVRNHLFLLGMIASEAAVITEHPDAAEIMQARNEKMRMFISKWSGQKNNTITQYVRDGDDRTQYTSDYGLDGSLADAYNHLEKNSEFRFQFTAMSTLTSYLHTALGKMVYTVYTVPGRGGYVADLLGEILDKGTVVASKPSPGMIGELFRVQSVGSVIAVRESSKVGRATIAPPPKAFADLVAEAHMNGVPVDDLELSRMFHIMEERGLLSAETALKCAKTPKMAKILEMIVKESPA